MLFFLHSPIDRWEVQTQATQPTKQWFFYGEQPLRLSPAHLQARANYFTGAWDAAVRKGICCATGRGKYNSFTLLRAYAHTAHVPHEWIQKGHCLLSHRLPTHVFCLCVSKDWCKHIAQHTTDYILVIPEGLNQSFIRALWSLPRFCWHPGCTSFDRHFSRRDPLGQLLA